MGIINLYNQFTNEHKEIKAEGKIKDILPEIDFNNCLILKAGHRITPDYEITKEDVLYIRQTPATATTVATIGVIVGVVALGVGVGSILNANKMNESLKDAQEKAQKKASQIDTLPFLKGSRNKSAMGHTIPFVMGSMFFTPYTLNQGFYSIGGTDGSEQFWNAVLVCGYNPQKVSKLYIKNDIVKTFDTTREIQDDVYSLESNIYQDENNSAKVEICSGGDLALGGLNQKVVPEVYGEEVVHEFNSDAVPLIKTLSENAQKVEICIRFDGLRQFDSEHNTYKERSVTVVPQWSNDNGATWNTLYFDISNSGLTYSYEWHTATQTEINQAITDGKIVSTPLHWAFPDGSYYDGANLSSNDSDWTVSLVSRSTNSATHKIIDTWLVKYRVKVTNPDGDNVIKRNSNKTIRFIATKTFSASESYGKTIQIKLTRTTPKLESNGQETCILDYIQTFCYDAKTSTSSKLKPCPALRSPFNDNVLKLGLRLKANKNLDNYADEIHIETSGMARTWNGTQWSTKKSMTRNPASWLLEILTSSTHIPSKIQDSDIDLVSFGRLYEYCNTNQFYCDSVITKGQKKSDIISGILSTVFADLIINSEGKYEVVIDKAETTPVAMLTSENVKSITYAKTFEREITGKKVTYTDRNNWTLATEYFMRNGSTEYNQLTDTLLELNLDYVTTHNHAYKIAQRQMRQLFLQPREISVDVGLEGDYYPLYSTVLLQLEKLKIGLKSSVIRGTTVLEDSIVKISLADAVPMENGKRYGVIIQAQSDSGRKLFYKEVINSGSGLKTELTLISAIDTTTESIVPLVNNMVAYGELNSDGSFDKVTNKMKIVGIESGSDNGFVLKLKDYNPQIYEVGTIPAYKSNYTKTPDKTMLNDSTKGEKGDDGADGKNSIAYKGTVDSADNIPEEVEENFFLCTKDLYFNDYLVINDAILTINGKNIVIIPSFFKGFIYYYKNNQWNKITDKNSYLYTIAQNDLIVDCSEVSPALEVATVEKVYEETGLSSLDNVQIINEENKTIKATLIDADAIKSKEGFFNNITIEENASILGQLDSGGILTDKISVNNRVYTISSGSSVDFDKISKIFSYSNKIFNNSITSFTKSDLKENYRIVCNGIEVSKVTAHYANARAVDIFLNFYDANNNLIDYSSESGSASTEIKKFSYTCYVYYTISNKNLLKFINIPSSPLGIADSVFIVNGLVQTENTNPLIKKSYDKNTSSISIMSDLFVHLKKGTKVSCLGNYGTSEVSAILINSTTLTIYNLSNSAIKTWDLTTEESTSYKLNLMFISTIND